MILQLFQIALIQVMLNVMVRISIMVNIMVWLEEFYGNMWHNTDTSIIQNCENSGEVTGNVETIFPKGISAGGIVGNADNLEVTACKNRGKIHYDIPSGTTQRRLFRRYRRRLREHNNRSMF